jgi:flavorubredoxin
MKQILKALTPMRLGHLPITVKCCSGSFGWSGEANDRIFDTMKHILKMDLVGDTLRLKSSSLGGGLQMAQDYGREIAKKLGS